MASLSVLCGQLLVVGVEGATLTEEERRLLTEGERGGVVLFRRNVGTMRQVAELTTSVRAAARAPSPIVAVDQEGGRVMRLGPPAMPLPPMRDVAALELTRASEPLLERLAEGQALELAALGFTMSFAPVADVHTREQNPIIGDRAFATTPELVARFARGWADGLRRGGVLSCAKHFPGHGDTTVDSHLALPRVERNRADVERIEIAPFRALARGTTVDAMMTAHVVYDALDPESPATLSRAICTDLLRGQLGFEGVLFSDDLEMKALTMPVGEAAVRAVLAGCDALLVCSRADLATEAFEALVREAEKSPTFRSRCEQACGRVSAMRHRQPSRAVAPTDAELARVFEASAPLRAELTARLSEQKGARPQVVS